MKQTHLDMQLQHLVDQAMGRITAIADTQSRHAALVHAARFVAQVNGMTGRIDADRRGIPVV